MVKTLFTCITLYAFFVKHDCFEISLHQGNTEILKPSGHTFLSPEVALLLSVQRISTSGKVQFSGYAQRICFVLSANQIVRLDCEHAQSDGKSFL